MKIILAALFLVISVGVGAGSVTGSALDAANTSSGQLEQSCIGDYSSSNARTAQILGTLLVAQRDTGQCMGSCASEQGICIAQCQGDGQCIGRCAWQMCRPMQLSADSGLIDALH